MALIKSEDEIGAKYDRFLANTVIKMGTGLAVGSLFSLFLFRRRLWPIYFATGTGFGFSANDLQRDLNERN